MKYNLYNKYIKLEEYNIKHPGIIALIQNLFGLIRHPLLKLLKNNLIIGSLCLILIKLALPTTFWIRIILLIIFTLLATIINVREKIKYPLAKILKYCLGFEFYFFNFHDIGKEDYYFSKKPKKFENIYKIYFEISWFLRYIFQRFYILINGFRFAIDTNPIIFLLIYYSIFSTIVIYDQLTILSYIGLFLIWSRLLIYFSNNSYSELINHLTCEGYNQELLEKKLRLSRKNIIIFTFLNIRDIEDIDIFDFDEPHEYIHTPRYLQDMNLIHSFHVGLILTDLPFEYVQNNTFKFWWSMFPAFKMLNNKVHHVNNININNGEAFKNKEISALLKVTKGHDVRTYRFTRFNDKPEIVECWATYTSSKKQNAYLVPPGAQEACPHTNNIPGDTTQEVVICYWEANSEEELNTQVDPIKQIISDAKFIPKDTPIKADFQNGVCLSLPKDLTKEDNYLLNNLIFWARTIKICSKNSDNYHTFGRVHNAYAKGEFRLALNIFNGIQEIIKNSHENITKECTGFCKAKGINNPTETDLLEYEQYAKSRAAQGTCSSQVAQQLIYKAEMHAELKTLRTPPGENIYPQHPFNSKSNNNFTPANYDTSPKSEFKALVNDLFSQK